MSSDYSDTEQSNTTLNISRKRANESEDSDFTPSSKKHKKQKKEKIKQENGHVDKKPKKVKREASTGSQKNGTVAKKSPKKKVKKEEEEKWRWWEEKAEPLPDGHHWRTLEHKGPIFAPPYERIPSHVKFEYDHKPITLSQDAEEVMTFYAKMLDHEYTAKDTFNKNFMEDWRGVMNHDEKLKITKLSKCNFQKVADYFKEQTEIKKGRSKEEKLKEKEKREELIAEYGYCLWDGHKEKVGNFSIEPPGLFRGRGEHPKMGKLKKRVVANQVILNMSKNAKVPTPPPGQNWKEIRHDPQVTWLSSWTENVQNSNKYVLLAANSKIKCIKDMAKYDKARRLHKIIDEIREDYRGDLKSKEMAVRQRAVAMYFIDRLALRAGNEKNTDEAADTVGCCSLRCEHIKLSKDTVINGKQEEFGIIFDFLGKDSIRYYNEVAVDKRVFKNVGLFMENKRGEDDLFDRVDTAKLNAHLTSIMDGLSAKVFRTYNASITLQNQLKKLTDPDSNSVPDKMLSYNRANRDVAILCNHQRAAPKNFSDQMSRMDEKIDAKIKQIKIKKTEVKQAKANYKSEPSEKLRKLYDQKKKQLVRLQEQLHKQEIAKTDKDENKTIALGTSKLNYLDPRISVAWCKKHDVPIEKVYNKTQREKFAWAIDIIMGSEEEYVF